jgi:hypothetical protein
MGSLSQYKVTGYELYDLGSIPDRKSATKSRENSLRLIQLAPGLLFPVVRRPELKIDIFHAL